MLGEFVEEPLEDGRFFVIDLLWWPPKGVFSSGVRMLSVLVFQSFGVFERRRLVSKVGASFKVRTLKEAPSNRCF